jgi:thiamine-monophosphate kinase
MLGRRLHAMIDISDGLALDLWRMCCASGTGAVLDEGRLELVVSDAAKQAAVDGRTPLDHALSDGEDFELLIAADGEVAGSPVPLFAIGQVTESGLAVRKADGRLDPLEPEGYVH